MTTDAELSAFWKRMVSVGSKVSGGLTGALTNYALGTPFLGAALSPFVAQGLERIGTEMVERRLAPRQDARVGRAIVVAAMRINERQEQGDVVREDSFFEVDGVTGRSASDEVTEAALQAAMNSAQEKKVDFIAVLLANIVFDKEINASTAHLMIETAEAVSYRIFVLLKIMSRIGSYCFLARGDDSVPGPPSDLHPLMAEVHNMFARGLMDMKDKTDDPNTYAFMGTDEVNPPKMFPSPLGKLLFDNMELGMLPDTDPVYVETVAELRRLGGYGRGATKVDGGTF